MRNLFITVIYFIFTSIGFAQLNTHSFEEISNLQKLQKRKVVVFIHTDWCKYCQAMKSKTLKNKNVIKKLNDNFYFIDLNAEEKRNIIFNNKIFKFKPSGINSGINELAIALGTIKNTINYPVLCILNDENEIIFQNNYFMNEKEFNQLLNEMEK